VKLYTRAAMPDYWVAHDESGALMLFPALDRGWEQAAPYRGSKLRLVEVHPRNAIGTGWPGVGRGRPPRSDTAATERLELRITADERAAWERAAGDAPLSVWLRDLANLAAGAEERVAVP
jgi:hypothetical protein